MPVEPGRVVGIGAICDIGSQRATSDARARSFSVSEFVMLDDDRRVLLHKDRGFTISQAISSKFDAEHIEFKATRDIIIQNVLTTVLPDEGESDEDHPWGWLAELARARGLEVTAEDLRHLNYEVVLSDEVIRWLDSL